MNTTKWSDNDRKLYLNLCRVFIQEMDTAAAWKWAGHIVNVNKCERDNERDNKMER